MVNMIWSYLSAHLRVMCMCMCMCVCVTVTMYISLHACVRVCMHYLVHVLGCMSCPERRVGMYAHCSWCKLHTVYAFELILHIYVHM